MLEDLIEALEMGVELTRETREKLAAVLRAMDAIEEHVGDSAHRNAVSVGKIYTIIGQMNEKLED